ncbi:MAG: hypothetical protein KIC94_01375 [Clostridiales bacterium]|nr:hypothetical protein [Clostridiales bacterium]
MVEFILVEYDEYEIDGTPVMDIYLYDYYDNLDNCADFSIEDANLLFNNIDFKSDQLQVDELYYTLKPYSHSSKKKTKPPN